MILRSSKNMSGWWWGLRDKLPLRQVRVAASHMAWLGWGKASKENSGEEPLVMSHVDATSV